MDTLKSCLVEKQELHSDNFRWNNFPFCTFPLSLKVHVGKMRVTPTSKSFNNLKIFWVLDHVHCIPLGGQVVVVFCSLIFGTNNIHKFLLNDQDCTRMREVSCKKVRTVIFWLNILLYLKKYSFFWDFITPVTSKCFGRINWNGSWNLLATISLPNLLHSRESTKDWKFFAYFQTYKHLFMFFCHSFPIKVFC